MGKPLNNKVFISTREKGKSIELESLIRDQGGQLLELPMIQTSLLENNLLNQDTLQNLHQFDWIVFTSQNGVKYFFTKIQELNPAYRLNSRTQIASIGSKTNAELRYWGYSADYINSKNTSLEFAEQLLNEIPHKSLVLLPLGSLANDHLQDTLSGHASIQRLDIYQTQKPKNFDGSIASRIFSDDYDLLIFTSPSGYQNFKTAFDKEVETLALKTACIGPITAEALRRDGIQPQVIASKSTAEGIVDSLIDYYSSKAN